MSTRSAALGKSALNGIDGLEAGAHRTVHAGAETARDATKATSRWAAEREVSATRSARLMKRRLTHQAALLRRAADDSMRTVASTTRGAMKTTNRYVQRNPWSAIAIASGAAILIGALLGRRRS